MKPTITPSTSPSSYPSVEPSLTPTIQESPTAVPSTFDIKSVADASTGMSSGTLYVILGLFLGILGLSVIVAAIYLYRDKIFSSGVNKQDSSYNIDFNDSEEINPNFFGRLSTTKPTRRMSAAPHFSDHYATGIFNDGGKLFVEENPTSDRLTLNRNIFGRSTIATATTTASKSKNGIVNLGENYSTSASISNNNNHNELL
jgi:hypothetical protein